jgi:hypothetical protein
MEQSPQVPSYSRNSPHFMETEGSSPQLQDPATCPYPEPDSDKATKVAVTPFVNQEGDFCFFIFNYFCRIMWLVCQEVGLCSLRNSQA